MYLRHFAFTRFPFDGELAPEELFPSSAIVEAEARLKHLLELQGIGLVTQRRREQQHDQQQQARPVPISFRQSCAGASTHDKHVRDVQDLTETGFTVFSSIYVRPLRSGRPAAPAADGRTTASSGPVWHQSAPGCPRSQRAGRSARRP
jgi:hypothetical protein